MNYAGPPGHPGPPPNRPQGQPHPPNAPYPNAPYPNPPHAPPPQQPVPEPFIPPEMPMENMPPLPVPPALFGNVPFEPPERSRIKRALGMQLGPEFVATRAGPGGGSQDSAADFFDADLCLRSRGQPNCRTSRAGRL